jgi:hypothetical protein
MRRTHSECSGQSERSILAEYRRLGDDLHPGEPDEACARDAEAFATWIGTVAARAPGEAVSLRYDGRYLRVAVIFVAAKAVLDEYGIDPHRRRAKRYIYGDKVDSVYLLARDPNVPAVEQLVESLRTDGLVAEATVYRYRLRPDYRARTNIARETAVCACLRRRRVDVGTRVADVADDDSDLPEEEFRFQAVPSNGGSGLAARRAENARDAPNAEQGR